MYNTPSVIKELKRRFWTFKPFWNQRCNAILGPKTKLAVPHNSQMHHHLIEDIEKHGLNLEDFEIDPLAYRTYVRDAGELYTKYRCRNPNFVEKSLEHFVAAQLLELESDDVYVDVASANSPTPEIYHTLYGCTTYRQDMIYPDGIRGNVIGGGRGGDAAERWLFHKDGVTLLF